MRVLFTYLIIVAALFVSNISSAQWNINPAVNTPVCVQPYNQQDVHIVTDGAGGGIMTWIDFRNDAAQNNGDIFAQRINKDGYTLWNANGIVLCTQAADQTAPAITESDSGSAIVAWTDQRNGTRDIYAQKTDSSGNILWVADGATVALKNATQQNVHLVSDGAGGAIIVWEDSVNGAFDIYAQRLSNAGAAMWTAGGVAVCSISQAQINPKIISDGAGGAIITWQDFRNGNDYNIYTQKINSSGAVQWIVNGVAISTGPGTQSNPKLRGDGSGGAIIAWQDKRSGFNFDVYAQRVNSAGVAQWTINGVVICNATDNQSAIDMTNENISGAIISWKDNRALNNDIYAQLINLSGIVQWAANGVAIANGTTEQINPNAVGDGSGGAIIVWQDSSAGNWDIKSQRISSSGTIMWTAGGEPVGIATSTQSDPKNVTDGLGGSIYVWNDKRSTTDYDIYAHHLFYNGIPTGIENIKITGNAHVFPNPFNQTAIIHISSDELNGDININIVDALGKEVNPIIIRNRTSIEIFRNNLPAGIYFYKIITASGKNLFLSGKFIITD
jgi:hypothetical protein